MNNVEEKNSISVMNNTILFVRRYPLSLLCIASIWYLCIWFLPPELPELENIAFLDKWTHFVMYGGTCSIIWWEYLYNHERMPWFYTLQKGWKRLLLLAWLAPILMSGCIEIIQEYCTENRTGEWLDLAANATGCTLGAIIGLFMTFFRGKGY